jgi:WS/DGAT/MGAT family acyltransferase
MAYTHYERLSALDASFLGLEDESSHMHVGSVSVFEAAPLEREGSLDVERIRQLVEGNLHKTPRYRQKLMWTPLTQHPVWVDDDRFNFSYHLRHVSLPPPGSERQLKRLAGRVMSQKLDLHKPLWELWLVEGLEGGRFATINKTHHCMIDGVSSAEMLSETMGTSPDGTLPEPHPFVPRPAPSPSHLLRAEVGRRVDESLSLVRSVGRALGRPSESVRGLRDSTEAVAEAVRAGLRPASATPLNCAIGPHRRFDWLRMPLEEIKEIKNELGGTINDVVLALASGALRRFLVGRGGSVGGLDFRAMLPVNVRGPEDAGHGNRVAMMVARLPLEVADPGERLAAVTEITTELKQSRQAEGVETIEQVGDFVAPNLMIQVARLAARARPFNMTITNVPGPQYTLYMLAAPLREVYGLVPLYRDQALGMVLFSYDGGLFWGLNADWDAVPDLHDVVDALALEFDALRKRAVPTARNRPTQE